MLIDCRRDTAVTNLQTDVAIVGGGAAGLTLALSLDAMGIDTVILEAGSDRFEQSAQQFYRAAQIEPESHGPVHLYRRRALGGTTAIWGGRCIPFDPIDFEDRPWIAHARWPVTYTEIAKYYPRALTLCRAGDPCFDAGSAQLGSAAPLIEGVTCSDVILDRIERFSEPTNFATAYRQRLNDSRTTTVLLNAPVTEILTNESGSQCTGVALRAAGRRRLVVQARSTVLAAGGLETPRLLLASNRARRNGLGNEHDLVGRFYQAHLEGEIGSIQFLQPPERVRLDYERSADGIYCRRYIWLSPEAQRREKLAGLIGRPAHANIVDPAHRDPVLSAIYLVKKFLVSEYARKLTSTESRVQAQFRARGGALLAAHLANVTRSPLRLSGFLLDWGRRRVLATRKLPSVVLRDRRNVYPLDINAEQSPNPDSRIRLGEERDEFDMPRLAIQWRMTDTDRERLARGMHVLQQAFADSGSARINLDALDDQVREISRIGGHHIGTVRMSDAPKTGVTDKNGALFATRGLFVTGASLFPTSGFANPTLTIVALALRLADHLGGNRT